MRPPSILAASVPMSMPGLARTFYPMTDRRPARGLLDISVVIDLEHIEPSRLPIEVAVSAITMAELAAGPHATPDPEERARRQDRLQRAEAAFDPLSFDAEAARAYGRVYSAVVAAGRKARGARAVDLLLAATACAAGLPLYTRNPDDFRAIGDLVEVIAV
jgi:predicted nucleic acid-binding protein